MENYNMFLLQIRQGKQLLTLWERDVNLLKPQQSYQLNRLEVRSFQGKTQLCLASAPFIDAIERIEPPIESFTSSKDDNETITGIRLLETVYTCTNCNEHITPTDSTNIAKCTSCRTTQICSNPKQRAKLH